MLPVVGEPGAVVATLVTRWPDAPVMSARLSVTAPARVLKVVTPPAAATAALTNAVVANCVVEVPAVAVGAVGVPVKAGLANMAPPTAETSAEVSVTAPVRPFHDVTPAVEAATAAATNAVVASVVLLVPTVWVGAVGLPVKVGEAVGAPPAPVMSAVSSVTAPVRVLKLDTPAVEAATAAVTNAVVATEVSLSPGAGVGAVGLPVKAGLASSAPPAPVMSPEVSVIAPVRPLKLVTAPAATT